MAAEAYGNSRDIYLNKECRCRGQASFRRRLADDRGDVTAWIVSEAGHPTPIHPISGRGFWAR